MITDKSTRSPFGIQTPEVRSKLSFGSGVNRLISQPTHGCHDPPFGVFLSVITQKRVDMQARIITCRANNDMKTVLLFILCLTSICVAEPIRKTGVDYNLSIEDGGRLIADDNGVPLELRDIKVTLHNLSQNAIQLTCLNSTYQSSYLVERNPQKIQYFVESANSDGQWSDARVGYSGFPSIEITLAPGASISFVAPLPYKRNVIPGKFRIKIRTSVDEKKSKMDYLISNEIKIE